MNEIWRIFALNNQNKKIKKLQVIVNNFMEFQENNFKIVIKDNNTTKCGQGVKIKFFYIKERT